MSVETGSVLERGFPVDGATERILGDVAFARAVTAYRFWYPTVSVEGIFNGNREVGLADNKGIGIASTGPLQVGFTLNSDTPYGAATLDLSDGPMVIELPAGAYIGLVDDHHQRWIIDMGIPGPDAGRGGKYVVLPPGYDGEVPDGYHVGRSSSFKLLLAVRALPVGGDLPKAMDALRAVRVYPLTTAANPEPLGFVDFTERAADFTCLRWEDNLQFWEVLHQVIDAEPVVDEFRPMYGLLSALGIEKGKPFSPDSNTAEILERAARVGRDQLLVSAFASSRPDIHAWPDRRWEWCGLVPDNADFETPAGLDLEARDRWFAQAIVASPAMFRRVEGGGSLYWLACRDATGAYLDGGRDYRLQVPLSRTRQAVLVGHRVRRRDPVPGSDRAGQGRAAVVVRAEGPPGRRQRRAEIRAHAAHRRRQRLDRDGAGPRLVRLHPDLWARAARVRRILEAGRHRADQLSATIASPISFAPMIRQITAMIVAFSRAIQSRSSARILVALSPIR